MNDKYKVLVIPSCDGVDYAQCLIIPADKYDYSDIYDAIDDVKHDEDIIDWNWSDIEERLIDLGYIVPNHDIAGVYWD